jgi:hypothetical protein
LAKISFPTAEFSCWERVSSPTAQVLAVGKAWGCWRSRSFLLWSAQELAIVTNVSLSTEPSSPWMAHWDKGMIYTEHNPLIYS